MSKTALIVVDVQHDFLPGGALAVPEGDGVIDPIVKLIEEHKAIDLVVVSRDAHPANHCSFQKLGGPWPDHCIDGMAGSAVHHRITRAISDRDLPMHVVTKGTHKDIEAYSAFDGTVALMNVPLHTLLRVKDIDTVIVCGLAYEYCVAHTVIDAVNMGFDVQLFQPGIRAIDRLGEDAKRFSEFCDGMEIRWLWKPNVDPRQTMPR